MATDVLLVRNGDRLSAADPVSFEVIEGMKQGEFVTATIRRSRNPKHHRKFFLMLSLVFKNQDRYATLEQLLDCVKIQTGHYDLVTLPGKIPVQMVKPRSISFAKMDQTSFSQFYEKAVSFIVSEVIPGLDSADLERQVLELLEPA